MKVPEGYSAFLVTGDDGRQSVVLVPRPAAKSGKRRRRPEPPPRTIVDVGPEPEDDALTQILHPRDEELSRLQATHAVSLPAEVSEQSDDDGASKPGKLVVFKQELLGPLRRVGVKRLTVGSLIVSAGMVFVIVFATNVNATALVFGAEGSAAASVAASAAQATDSVDADSAVNAMNRRTTGTVTIDGEQVNWQLVQPIIDNRRDFGIYFPDATYLGDIGDASHFDGRLQDHTPRSTDDYQGIKPQEGWIYAQDIGGGSTFNVAQFSRWLLDRLREGKYPEVKYVITRQPENSGSNEYYGCFSRQYGWESHSASGHDFYVHISYMMTVNGESYETRTSTIIEDFANWLASQ